MVTNRLLEVQGEAVFRPERGTLLGAARIVPVEYPDLRCAAVDLDFGGGSPEELREAAERLLAFLTSAFCWETAPAAPLCALRGPWCWRQDFEPAPLPAPSEDMPPLRTGGVYLVTGGLGGMGLYLAEHLARTAGARLILVGRSGLPERDEWDAWLAGHGDGDLVGDRIRRIRALEAAGTELLVRRADVADAERMAEVLTEARRRFGRLHGVVHCAGIADWAGVIHLRTREATEAALAAKLRGTLVLAHLLREEGLDFLVLCSTLGSVLVHQKYGQVGYAAANAFLDVFPTSRPAGLGKVITLNWDDWRQVGMTVEAEARWAATRALPDFAFFTQETLLPAEGVEVFRRALAHGLPRVLVSTRDLRELVRQDAAVAAAYRDAVGRAAPREPRPVPAGGSTVPGDPLERVLAELWSEVLGAGPGGGRPFSCPRRDSLAGLTLAGRIERRLGVSLGMPELLECGTIAALAARLAARRPGLAGAPGDGEGSAAPAIAGSGARAWRAPSSFAQQRLWSSSASSRGARPPTTWPSRPA